MNMKKNDILKLTAVSLVFSCMISCGIDIEEMKEADPDAGTELELALSCAEPLVLNESNAAETALSLSWTSGSNFGTGSSISYTLEIDRADGTWDGCYSEDLGKKVYSAEISVEELNTILNGTLDAVPGTAGDYKVRIMASVTDHPEYDRASESAFTATTYSPVPDVLYITGTCTDGDWDPSQAVQMTRDAAGVFTYETVLEASEEFRFITSTGSEYPAYVRAEGSDDGLSYAAAEPQYADFNFTAPDGKSKYRITADLLDMKVTVEDIMPQTLYIIGDALPDMWDLNNKAPMTMVSSGIFTWSGALMRASDAGKGIKFLTGNDWWPGYVKANDDESDMSLAYYESQPADDADRKFAVPSVGNYKIDVDLFEMTASIERTGDAVFTTLFMIGDATPGGWSLDNATRMTASGDGIYTWTGTLKASSFRFVVSKADFAPGYWKADDDASDMGIRYSETSLSGTDDRSFSISEEGEYTVTADTANMTVTITKK